MKLNYPVNTSYNRNFKEYFSYLPDIGHDCSGYGETIEQSLENLKVQQRNIFRDYLEIGRRIPKPYSKGNTEYV
jgi:predicted RNase H-like HicB family nuclease